ncbi:MAG: ribosomal-processing cysteine protease Prp [Clostridia bacterium]|nr:ribosomal-processing cysteine protease Prp [Clostridia bacterium]
MISVTVNTDRDLYELRLEGHALYCPGNDIVCAAVSALTFALVGWVSNNPEHVKKLDKLTGYGELLPGGGKAHIKAVGDQSLRSAFMTAVIGLCQVAVSYPDNVRVHINGVLVTDKEGER